MRFGRSTESGHESEEATGKAPSPNGLTAAQEQMVVHLHGAGFSVPEIAHMVGHSPDDVQAVLKAA